MNAWRRCALGLILASIAASAAAAADTAWWISPDDRPALAALGDLDGAQAVAVGADGAIAAAAFVRGKHGDQATLRIAGGGKDGVETLELPGEVRALRFADGGRELLVILAKRSKRRPPETQLFSIELDSLRTRRRLQLPHSAHAMTFWTERSALVVTSHDEVRTFLLPEYNSGPLFRVPGDHRSIEPIDGSTFVLATGTRAIVVDFTDVPSDDGLPVRASLDAGENVIEIAVLATAPRIAVRRESADPVRLALPATAFTAPAPRETTADPDPDASAVTPPPGPTTSAPAAVTTAAAATPSLESPPADVPFTSDPAAGTAATPDPPADDLPSVEMPDPPDSAANAAPAADPSIDANTGAAIRGRISGDGLESVLAVVAYGPDNVLREAARIAPRADGSFAFADLAPGSYRIALDGGGERLVESNPPFQIVRVSEDGGATAQPFMILRVR